MTELLKYKTAPGHEPGRSYTNTPCKNNPGHDAKHAHRLY
jgi:hypothetical protein